MAMAPGRLRTPGKRVHSEPTRRPIVRSGARGSVREREAAATRVERVDELHEPLDLLLEELLSLARLSSFAAFSRPIALAGARKRRALHLEVGRPPSQLNLAARKPNFATKRARAADSAQRYGRPRTHQNCLSPL